LLNICILLSSLYIILLISLNESSTITLEYSKRCFLYCSESIGFFIALCEVLYLYFKYLLIVVNEIFTPLF
jgi:hypothetical protein